MTTALPVDRLTASLGAIGAMVASQAVFTVNDTMMKLAARELASGQAIFIRGLVTIVLSAMLAAALGGFRAWPPAREWPRIALRNVGEIGATLLYLTALFHMPITDITAIMQFLPLAITAGAALFLGELVGWRRWLATAVGLVGVLIIIRPGTSAFSGWSLVALLAVASVALRDLTTRRIDRGVPTVLLTFISSVIVTIAALGMAIAGEWKPVTAHGLGLTGGAALFLLAGYYFIIEAMRRGDVALVAPFRYSAIVWAILAGIVVFGEWPDPIALAGTALVIAAGLYTFFRERQLAKQRSAA